MSRTRAGVLWGVLCPAPWQGYPHTLRMTSGARVLPLFSTPHAAESWIWGLGLDRQATDPNGRHFLTQPLTPRLLVLYAEMAADEWGFTDWTLDPSTLISQPVQYQTIEGLIAQAERQAG